MHLCRACEVVLWRRRPSCPSCGLQGPALRMVLTLPRTSARLERLGVGLAVLVVVAMVGVDRALHWLLVTP